MKIDHRLLLERRRRLGLSQRSVARAASLSLTVVRNLESTGDASFLTLRTLGLVAAALSVSVSDLLLREPASGAPTAGVDQAVLPEIGSALFRHRDGLSVEALALALGCSGAAVDRALEALTSSLRAVGLMLHRSDGQIVLAPAAPTMLTGEVLRTAITRTSTRPQIDDGDAAFVYAAMSGARSAKAQRSNANGVLRTGRLRNHGLLKEPDKETSPMVLSDEVRFSLMLDDEPSPVP